MIASFYHPLNYHSFLVSYVFLTTCHLIFKLLPIIFLQLKDFYFSSYPIPLRFIRKQATAKIPCSKALSTYFEWDSRYLLQPLYKFWSLMTSLLADFSKTAQKMSTYKSEIFASQLCSALLSPICDAKGKSLHTQHLSTINQRDLCKFYEHWHGTAVASQGLSV